MLKLFRLLKPFTLSITVTLVLVFLQSIADLSLPTLMSSIVDDGIAKNDIPLIWKTGGRMLLIALAGVIANVIAGYLAARSSMGFGTLLRSRVFARVSSFSLLEMDRFGSASLITRTTNDVSQVQQVLFMMLRMMAMAPMMAIGGIVMAVSKEPKLAWILLVVLPVMTLVIVGLGSKALPLFKAIQARLDGLNRVLRENLTGIRVIRAFDRAERERGRFDAANADLTSVTLKVNRLMASMFPVVMLLMNLTTIMIVWFGGLAVDSGGVQIGSLMAFIQYAMQIMFAVIMVTVMFIMVPRASASAERINEVLEAQPGVVDPPTPVIPARREGRVEFRNVTFRYPGAEEPALRGVSFVIEPGTTAAIIGGTGSGKSTIVNLVARFYDVEEGAVLVDGVDVRDMTQAELRSRLGLAPQRAVLFSGTVADNLRFGAPGAGDADVEAAAETAQAADFIMEKEGGYAATISQGGVNVSGGQKQRLAIARALARKPPLYLFDDAFSALDFKTDARLRSALRKTAAGSTVVIVAQRVGTVRHADRILVLDDGRLVGDGKHHELMDSCPVYRDIVESQLGAEEAV